MSPDHYTISIKSAVGNLEKVRLWASHIARTLGFEERAVFEIEISVYEACANVIEHAYGNDPGQYIDLHVTVEPDRFVVTVKDDGGAFNPPPAARKDIAAIIHSKQEGGLGLYIIETCMDEILYRRQGGRNILELVKYLPRVVPAR